MRFWWVSQRKNYDAAIKAGSLWTVQNWDSTWRWDRRPIIDLTPGDLVVHHARGVVRAVSRVTASAVPCARPLEYPNTRGDRDDGLIVRVEAIRKDLWLTRDEFAQLIPHGVGVAGPLTKAGIAKQAYLQPLSPDVATRVLTSVGLSTSDLEPTLPMPYEWSIDHKSTDSVGLATLRLEQGRLRAYLLGAQTRGRCDLCGRELPADLLVAAHIQPRRDLSDEQRAQFDRIAMLACLLGCDAMFEAGYLAVDENGVLVTGREAPGRGLAKAVSRLAGRTCPRHNELTAPHFAARLALAVSN